jgi:hypothetical protein
MDNKLKLEKIKNFVEQPDLEEEVDPSIPTPLEPEPIRFERIDNKFKEYKAPYGEHKQDPYLNKIMQLESSGGKNTNHRTMESGMHEGSAAIGRWGLMPHTVRGVAKDLSNKQSLLYKTMGPGYQDKEVQALGDLSDEELKDRLTKDPTLEKRIARYMASRLDRFEGDEVDKAARWFFGSNLPKEQIEKRNLRESDYAKKFQAEDES